MLRRFGLLSMAGVLALMVLAACGEEDDEAEPTVTRAPAENVPAVTNTPAEDAGEPATAASPVGSPVSSPVAGQASPVATAASPVAGSASPVASEPAVPAAAAIEVDMQDIKFVPTEITIPASTDVTVTLVNSGAAVHNFNVDALDIHSGDYSAGQTGTVTINAPAGEYDYLCNIPGHKEAGMVGKLIVQ